ncbi:hypothetical protein [Sulfobacillus thermosulfidooxidans]|uniref:hypothetical protein n=1 Tax=Sulfobacillus thermosulfidooxidans TaxID=28034 RepID=UPI0006B5F614|nr:hypothetical protein [Sulfobacillus thermosulfidooxidans]
MIQRWRWSALGILGLTILAGALPSPVYAWSWSGGGWSSGGWSTPTTSSSGGSTGGWSGGWSAGDLTGFTIGGVTIPTASLSGVSVGGWTYTGTTSSGTSGGLGNATGTSLPSGAIVTGNSLYSNGYSDPLTQTIGSSTPGFQSIGGGQYTYNACAAQTGGLNAFVNGQSVCLPAGQGCPPGEAQIDGDGVCQGTGSDNPGIYPQWTFSACVNGYQTEYTHNVQTNAIESQSTVPCVANPVSTTGTSTSSVPTTGTSAPTYTPPPYTPPPVVTTSTQTVVGTFTFAACMPNPEETTYNGQSIQPPQNDQWVTAGNAPPNTLLPGPGWAIDVAPQTLVTTTCTGTGANQSCVQSSQPDGSVYQEAYDPNDCPYPVVQFSPNPTVGQKG